MFSGWLEMKDGADKRSNSHILKTYSITITIHHRDDASILLQQTFRVHTSIAIVLAQVDDCISSLVLLS